MQDESKHFGSGQVAKLLGIPRWKLLALIDRGQLPEATHKLAGRRLFTATDVTLLQERLRGKTSRKEEQTTSN